MIQFPKYISLKSYTLKNIDEKIQKKKDFILSYNLKDIVNDVAALRNTADDMKSLADLYETRTIMQAHELYKQYEFDEKPCDFLTYIETFYDENTKEG